MTNLFSLPRRNEGKDLFSYPFTQDSGRPDWRNSAPIKDCLSSRKTEEMALPLVGGLNAIHEDRRHHPLTLHFHRTTLKGYE
jgi:hypothetical protein